MLIRLRKNATTTPATRLAIQQATGNEVELAAQFGVGRLTICKWRRRSTVDDASHTPHRLQTTLNAGQEEIVVYLRTHLRRSLDDLLAVVHEFIELAMSRSGLDRLLRRRGVNRLPWPKAAPAQIQTFKAYEPGYVHMGVKYLPQMPSCPLTLPFMGGLGLTALPRSLGRSGCRRGHRAIQHIGRCRSCQ
jgi:hypothetical protein